MEQLLKVWPIFATIMGLLAPLVAWAVVMLWRIAQGVKDVQHKLERHNELHAEHQANTTKNRERLDKLDTQLQLLHERQRGRFTPVNVQAVQE